MRYRQVLLAWIPCLIAMSPGCGGCPAGTDRELPLKPPSREVTGSPDASVSAFLAQQAALPPELQWSLLVGEDDSTNRYASTVSLIAHAPAGERRYRQCSGVLLTPRLVLTAGHCVCRPHRGPQPSLGASTRIDASACAATATVSTYTYAPGTDDEGPEAWSVYYSGDIRPHPQLQILLDARGAVSDSRADLALVRLEKPVQKNILPARLAEKEVQEGELLTVVGYGYIEDVEGMDGRRRFSQEKALKFMAPAGTRVLFGSPERHAYKGDTGGPCFRETAQGPELLGISQRGLGLDPAFTRIAPYRDWLEEETQGSSP